MLRESLKQRREELSITQNEVAEYLNISPQSVSKWERGESLPSVEYLPKLAELFYCKIDDLFDKFPYRIIREDEFFKALKENTEKSIENAKQMVKNNNLLSKFLYKLCKRLLESDCAFVNVFMEDFNFSYSRARKLMNYLYDLNCIELKFERDYVLKENLGLLQRCLL